MRKGWQISFRADSERAGTGSAGDYPCSRGEWCASATRVRLDDGTTDRAPASTNQAFCPADLDIIGNCIGALPATYARLARAIGDQVTGEVVVRMPFGPSTEIRTDVDEIQRVIADSLMTWLERVAMVDPTLSPVDTQDWRARSLRRRAGGLVQRASGLLAQRVSVLTALAPEPMMRPALVPSLGCGETVADAGWSWRRRVAEIAGLEPGSAEWDNLCRVLPAQPDDEYGQGVLLTASGADAGNELMRLDYLARAALLETNPDTDKLLGVGCEACGHRSLRRAAPPQHDGDPFFYAACDDCGNLMTDEEFKAWTGFLVRFYARSITPAMLACAGLRGDETPAIAAAAA